MTFDRSVELQNENDRNKVEPPPETNRRFSIKNFLMFSLPVIFGVAILIFGLWYFTGFQFWYAMVPTVLIAWYLIYREYWKWSRNHITCKPSDGIMHVEDRSHPFILFFITGSSDDQIPLDIVNLDTPTRSFFDRYVFHCCTLIAGDRTLRGVRNAEELLKIKKYRESMKKEAIELDRQQVDVQMAILLTLEDIGRRLDALGPIGRDLAFVASCQSLGSYGSSAPHQDPTQPIPSARQRGNDRSSTSSRDEMSQE